jgi:drug/metabolite transporter (DMT)-like permease
LIQGKWGARGVGVAGATLGVAILGERLSAGLLGGMALVALGLVLIARR